MRPMDTNNLMIILYIPTEGAAAHLLSLFGSRLVLLSKLEAALQVLHLGFSLDSVLLSA